MAIVSARDRKAARRLLSETQEGARGLRKRSEALLTREE